MKLINISKSNQTGSKSKLSIATGIATLLAVSAMAGSDVSETFRTLAYGTGVYQGTNAGGKPAYKYLPLAGHDLVDAALGVPLGTRLKFQVLALQINCASTDAQLVVFDTSSSNVVAFIAASTSLEVVQQQGAVTAAFPNRERFVAQFAVTPTNNLLGGFLTVAGRLDLNPTNGCPRAVFVDFDGQDHAMGDKARAANHDDLNDQEIRRAGLGHAVGAVDLKFNNGTTNTMLLPFVALSMRRPLN